MRCSFIAGLIEMVVLRLKVAACPGLTSNGVFSTKTWLADGGVAVAVAVPTVSGEVPLSVADESSAGSVKVTVTLLMVSGAPLVLETVKVPPATV